MTISGVVTAEGQELQVIVVDAESAAWTPDRTAIAAMIVNFMVAFMNE